MPFKNFPIGGTFPLRGGHTPSKALSIRGQKQLNRRRTSRRWLLLCVALPSRPAQVTRYSSGCGFSLWPPSRQRHACRQESRAIYLGACLGLFWVLSLCPCCRNALEYLPRVQTSQSAAPSQATASRSRRYDTNCWHGQLALVAQGCSRSRTLFATLRFGI